MISTDCMDSYTNNKELNREILVWINQRILSVLIMYLELGNDTEWDDEYLSICFPRTFIEDNGAKKCVCILYDIHDVLESDYVRTDLKLLYKYVLIKLIKHYQILYDDARKCGNYELCNIFFPPMENSLKKKIYKFYGYKLGDEKKYSEEDNVDGGYPWTIINVLEDIDGLFWDDVFDDTEVDIDYIDNIVDKQIDRIQKGQGVELDFEYYVDLMSRPTKERYYRVKPLVIKMQEKMIETVVDNIVYDNNMTNIKCLSEETLLQDICLACIQLQASEEIILKGENARNTYIRDMLRSKGYFVADQTLRGQSLNKKQLGELDFEIMATAEKTFAIFEALNLNNFSNTGQKYLKSHLKKLLENYNPMGVKLTFLVIYATWKKKDFNSLYSKFLDYIRTCLDEEYTNCFVREHEQSENYIKCVEYKYGKEGIYTTVYHIVVCMNE